MKEKNDRKEKGMMRKIKKEERKNIIRLPGSLAMFSAF
jgi:hypothetical protein